MEWYFAPHMFVDVSTRALVMKIRPDYIHSF